MAEAVGQATEPQPDVLERLTNYLDQPPEQEQEEPPAEAPPEPEQEEPGGITIDPSIPMFDVTIRVEGGASEVKKVSLNDLESGYMMQSDYQRKTAELARARDTLAQEAQQIVEPQRQAYMQNLQVLQQAVVALTTSDLQNVDWERLSVEDPAKYVQLSAKATKAQQLLQGISQQQQMAQQQAYQQAAQASARVLSDPVQGIPDFFQAVYPKLINETAKIYGFTPQEVAQVVDHRMLRALNDARQFRELQAAKPGVNKKVAAAPKVLRPGQPAESGDLQAREVKELSARLKKSGDLKDAAALYLARQKGR